MKKVYVVVPDYGYEGYGTPRGVFSDREKAEDARKALLAENITPNDVEVLEYEIDKTEE